MLATSVVDAAAAWVGLPVAYAVTGLGVGLLVERALGLRLAPAALLPLGACASLCLLLAVYELGGTGIVAAALLVALALGGLLIARRALAARLRPGPAAAAALLVAGLYLAPTVLTGGWSWNGYDFLNDTAVQFVLADELKHHGVAELQNALSTRSQTIRAYLASGYPLGTHAHVATLATLLGSGVDVVYQGYLAMLAATAAAALTGIARRAGLGPFAAAGAGAGALTANLIYQYALQGSIKEVAAFMALAAAALLGGELLRATDPVRAAVALGVAAAAMLGAFSVAAGPYLAALALCLLAGVLLLPAPAARARLPWLALAGVVATAAAAVPTLLSLPTFLQVSQSALGAGATQTSVLGQLEKPLDLIQVAGVWLSENYQLPIIGRIEWHLTLVASWLILALAVVGAVVCVRRRALEPLLLALPALVAAAVVAPRASPYADAKLLALACPAVAFLALYGALAWRGRARAVGRVGGGLALLGLLSSAAFAYHGVRVAPVDRMGGLEAAVASVQDRGWILLDEREEFAKYYGRNAPNLDAVFEALSPRHAQPFGGGYHLDLDQLEPDFVQGFDAILTRRGPATSRPPASYRRVYANRWYEAWVRRSGVRVRAHLGLQGQLDAGARARCAAVRALARRAGSRGRIVAAPASETVMLDVVRGADRPLGWPPLEKPDGVVEPRTPGFMEQAVRLEGGHYDAWVRGSTGRPIHASVDGRRIGTVHGLNSEGQWLEAADVRLPEGRHTLGLERPAGGLAPGDGVKSVLGPLALVRREPRTLREIDPRDAARLCGKRWDWIEVLER